MINKNKKVKIVICYHKPYLLLKNKVYVPVHVGRELIKLQTKDGKLSNKEYNWLLKNTIGDNTGDNISGKNRKYCEITAQYWVWKNYKKIDDPEYIGFMHYRRHFEFIKPYGKFLKLSPKKQTKIIEEILENKDIIAPKLHYNPKYNNYAQYSSKINCLYAKDYDKALEVLLRLYPEYKNTVDRYNASHYAYYCNMFIMKKEIFFDYCNWLFPILKLIDEEIDSSQYNIDEIRYIGHLSERLFGLYYSHNKIKLKTKDISVITFNTYEKQKNIFKNLLIYIHKILLLRKIV